MPASHSLPAGTATIEEATFAGGCFWCIEAAFNRLQGVIEAESGSSNGEHPAPDYEAVCSGETGHAEVVRVRFDPAVICYAQLLQVFFTLHDPTTLNRQGHDIGTQYRSAIYTHDAAQQEAAQAFMAELTQARVFDAPIVTEVAPIRNYHPAEPYHQRYFDLHPGQGYCAVVIAPKLNKLAHQFAAQLKAPAAE
jgi:peptide-methionine (S)-S-oxide reductase